MVELYRLIGISPEDGSAVSGVFKWGGIIKITPRTRSNGNIQKAGVISAGCHVLLIGLLLSVKYPARIRIISKIQPNPKRPNVKR